MIVATWVKIPVARSVLHYLWWRFVSKPVSHKGYVINAGAKVSYQVLGEGIPLVLLHGGLSSSLDWMGEIPTLSREFRLIVIELRGHGRSSLGSQPFTYRLLAADVRAVLDDLGVQRCHLMGWSDGGNTGLLFALNYPTRVVALIVIGANYHPDGVSANPAGSEESSGSWVSAWLYRIRSNAPEKWPVLHEEVTKMWRNDPQLTDRELSTIEARTLVVVGSEDLIELPHSKSMAAAIPRAELLVLPDIGHSVPRDAPRRLCQEAMKFLGEVGLERQLR